MTPVFKAIFLSAVLAVGVVLVAEPLLAADSECSSDSGIPSDVIAPIDVGHLRKSLADAGFAVGGFYVGETFANTGVTPQGFPWDGHDASFFLPLKSQWTSCPASSLYSRCLF